MEFEMTIDNVLDEKNIINRFMDIFDASNEGLWEMTFDNKVNFYNNNFYENLDVSLKGSNLEEWIALIHPEDIEYFSNNVNQQVSDGLKRVKSQYRVKNKSGQYIWIEATGVTRFDKNGRYLYMIGSHKDITKEKMSERYIYNIAYIDQLTGLLNRSKLVEQLKGKIESQTDGALIYVNLNNFRLYLDTFGYKAGNDVIITVSDNLKSIFRNDCELFRINTYEFVVLISTKTTETILVSYIDSLLRKFKRSIKSLNETYTHTMSIGVNMLPSEEKCEEALIYQAKLTTLYAKDHISKEYAFFDKKIQSNVEKKLYIETGIKSAIRNREFFLKYQPIISSETKAVESFEALLRWNSKKYGEIMPDDFIPVAERNRDIIELGYYVLLDACSFISRYNSKNNKNLKISVNVSVLQLLQDDFIKRVTKIISLFDLKPQHIVIEVTESLLLDSNDFAREQIGQLKDKGFLVSLDDFGTGYSSLNSFFSIPFTQLKIDKEVTLKAMSSREASAYVSFLTSLCYEKNIEVVGEGIETKEMAKEIKNMGVDLLQGYFFSKPVCEKDAFNIK
ncbi:EAL domain-containing protein [Photobacterium sagamiensis]|uniref:bifunctional diguanylate cyclase/phosphodiesterase n=1 Tax=Photobacterium sagamiensis TaxID=2910241 RepID=UPI003D0F6BCD